MSDEHTESSSTTGGSPRKWWQWILLYPAFAIALLSAAPEWINVAKAYYLDLRTSELPDAEKLNEFFSKNLSCLATPSRWVESPENILVDGTICNSGDILIKVQLPKPYEKTYFRAINLDDIVKRQAMADPLGLASYASTAPAIGAVEPRMSVAPEGSAYQRLAQQFSITVCQKRVNNRTIMRHVKVKGVCYDEYIDTYTGEMTKREQVPCRNSC